MFEDFYWEEDSISDFRRLNIIHKKFIREKEKFINYNGQFRMCSKCREKLPLNSYFFHSGGKDKYHRYCKLCEGSSSYGWGRKENNLFNESGQHYCTKCDRILPLNEYYFSKTTGRCNKTGFSSNCKECRNKDSNFQFHSLNNYHELLDIKKGFKICSDCLLELPDNDNYYFNRNDREYGHTQCKNCKGFEYGVHRINRVMEKHLPVGYKFCSNCLDIFKVEDMSYGMVYCQPCANEKSGVWSKTDKGKQYKRQFRQIRRAKQLFLRNDLTEVQWDETLKYFDHSCAYCGTTEEKHKQEIEQVLHQEHVIPISKDGEYTKNNIIPACRKCNYAKYTMSLKEFYIKTKHFSEKRYNKILNFILENSEVIQNTN